MAFATAWIAVDPVDELAHGMLTISDDHRRFAAGGGNQFVTNHQNAVVLTGQETFDQHFVADFRGDGVGRFDLLAGSQIDGNAFALVAVLRLDHHGKADFAGGDPGVFGVIDGSSIGNRDAGCLQQFLGQFLVLGNRFGDCAGLSGFGGLDTPLLAAPAELHHAAFGQAAVGDVAGNCSINDGAGTWPEAHILVELAQAF